MRSTVVPAAPTPEHEFHLDAPLVPTAQPWAQETAVIHIRQAIKRGTDGRKGLRICSVAFLDCLDMSENTPLLGLF